MVLSPALAPDGVPILVTVTLPWAAQHGGVAGSRGVTARESLGDKGLGGLGTATLWGQGQFGDKDPSGTGTPWGHSPSKQGGWPGAGMWGLGVLIPLLGGEWGDRAGWGDNSWGPVAGLWGWGQAIWGTLWGHVADGWGKGAAGDICTGGGDPGPRGAGDTEGGTDVGTGWGRVGGQRWVTWLWQGNRTEGVGMDGGTRCGHIAHVGTEVWGQRCGDRLGTEGHAHASERGDTQAAKVAPGP